jgi:predicted kinase
MSERKVWILVGTIGCGKSSWAKQIASKNPKTKIVSADKFREMFNGQYVYEVELDHLITGAMWSLSHSLLLNGYDVIIDVCNMTRERRAPWLALPATRVAVLFPWKDKQWHIDNWNKNPKKDNADPGKIYDGNLKAFEPINEDDVDLIVNISEF